MYSKGTSPTFDENVRAIVARIAEWRSANADDAKSQAYIDVLGAATRLVDSELQYAKNQIAFNGDVCKGKQG